MRSKLAFRKRHGTAAPAFNVMVGVGGRPFCKFGLRTHQTLHWRYIGEYKAAFATLIRCRRQAHNKQEFNHSFIFPVICFFSSSRSGSDPRLKSVNTALRQHSERLKSPNRLIMMHKKRPRPTHFAVAA